MRLRVLAQGCDGALEGCDPGNEASLEVFARTVATPSSTMRANYEPCSSSATPRGARLGINPKRLSRR